MVIIPHNFTNKFQPLDVSVNQAAKKNHFIQVQNRVGKQLSNGIALGDVKVSL